MEGLRSTNDIRQAEAANELAELLLMGNEESLPNLPIREVVQLLNTLMQKENNLALVIFYEKWDCPDISKVKNWRFTYSCVRCIIF